MTEWFTIVCRFCGQPYRHESKGIWFCSNCSRRWEDKMPEMTEAMKQETQRTFEEQYKEPEKVYKSTQQVVHEALVADLSGKEEKKEAVNHPEHYGGKDNPYEVVKIAEATGLDKDAYLFNVLKYIIRADKKEAKLEDLEKARWYLDRRIALMKGFVFHGTYPTKEEIIKLKEKIDSIDTKTFVTTIPTEGTEAKNEPVKEPGVILSKEEIRQISDPALLKSQIELWYRMADKLYGSLAVVMEEGVVLEFYAKSVEKGLDQFKQYDEAWNKVDVKKDSNKELPEHKDQGIFTG